MAGPVTAAPAEAFFLAASPGQRFCMYYAAAAGATPRGGMVYIHPFGEEMNRSRRMAALQARAFAAAGYHVLQIDLYGCGDSSGDFGEARWPIWKHDVLLACRWLVARRCGTVSLWGLRLGATLALDLAHQTPTAFARLILWYPVLNGKVWLDQLLRQHLAGQMLTTQPTQAAGAGAVPATVSPRSTGALRQSLAAGTALEIGGYLLAPELALSIDHQDTLLTPPPCAVLWFEHSAAADGAASPAALRQAAAWRTGGDVRLQPVRGAPFWSSPTIVDCPALLEATLAGSA
jgi:exosortase A-associated hydrolase 2